METLLPPPRRVVKEVAVLWLYAGNSVGMLHTKNKEGLQPEEGHKRTTENGVNVESPPQEIEAI